MTRTLLLIHGAWLTPASLDTFRTRYEAQGYRVLSPAWPHMDRSVAELNNATPDALSRLDIGVLVDHYAAIIDRLDASPLLIGHDYGGLIVQMLLDRGYGAAGVAIAPAPAAGIRPGAKALAAALPVLLSPKGWNRAHRLSFGHFVHNFAHDFTGNEQGEVFTSQIVPAPGRVVVPAYLGVSGKVNWANPDRAPLLLIAAEGDRMVEPAMVAATFRRYKASPAVTDFKLFPGRGHLMTFDYGWRVVADHALDWLAQYQTSASDLPMAA